jgi:ABC-type Fe3+ transport system substrate-binding protein
MGVLKAAQHPNAGLVFINWYLSKEGQDAGASRSVAAGQLWNVEHAARRLRQPHFT